ncbi:MAG: hypothetical protein OHK0029_33980 [Armatimonadaceae bacterium]
MLGTEAQSAGFRLHYQLYYQPVVRVRHDGELVPVVMEAFLRLHHPKHGLLAADASVAVAKQAGLLPILAGKAARQACADLLRWRRDGYDGRVSINIGSDELTPELAEAVALALRETGTSGDSLILEITPARPLRITPEILSAASALSRNRVLLLLDGIRTSTAVLNSLTFIPFAGYKFSIAALIGGSRKTNSFPVLSELLALTSESERSLVATHVETTAQREFLVSHGCELMQGHLFGPSAPAEAVPALLRGLNTSPPTEEPLYRRELAL